MKSLRLIIALLCIGIAIGGYAQDSTKKKGATKDNNDTEVVSKKDSKDSKASPGATPTRSAASSSNRGGTTELGAPKPPKDDIDPREAAKEAEKKAEAEKEAMGSMGSKDSRDSRALGSGSPQVSRAGSTSGSSASSTGVSKRGANAGRQKKDGSVVSDRQQSFYEVKEPSDADLQWVKVIYREVNLLKDKNTALLYPEMPNEDGENLYFIIMRLLAKNQISAYDYQDEIFTDKHKINVGETFDNYGIYYTEAKGSTEKNPIYEFEDADIRANQVLSYYIIEKWEFDTRSNQMKARVEYLCPVIHQEDDWSGETGRYPMFWVKLNDIRPYMARQYVFTDDDNNLARYSIDDFFKLNMYTGDIIKTKNLRNLSLKQMYPEEKAYKHAQDSIEQRLRSFNQDLWVPSLDVLQARAEAEEKARAEAEGEIIEDEEGVEKVETDGGNDEEKEKVTRSTKRGSKSKDTKSSLKSSSKAKTKKTKIKERKPKTSTQSVNTGVRSVRNRRK